MATAEKPAIFAWNDNSRQQQRYQLDGKGLAIVAKQLVVLNGEESTGINVEDS